MRAPRWVYTWTFESVINIITCLVFLWIVFHVGKFIWRLL